MKSLLALGISIISGSVFAAEYSNVVGWVNGAGSVDAPVASAGSWSATTDQTWITPDLASGTGAGVVTLDYAPAPDGNETANLTVDGINYKILQLVPERKGDLNADGHADFIWQRNDNGQIYRWDGAGGRSGAITGGGYLTSQVSNYFWKIAAHGDFNNDHHQDLIWQHAGNNYLYIWPLSSDHKWKGPTNILQTPADQNWKIVGAEDANGDGNLDLYWQHQTANTSVIWYFDGSAAGSSNGYISSGLISQASSASAPWDIMAIGDVDGNGKPDLIWQHQVAGTILVWFMNGHTLVSSAVLPYQPGIDWKVRGANDFDGDGVHDILLRDETGASNQPHIYYMSGSGATIDANSPTIPGASALWDLRNSRSLTN